MKGFIYFALFFALAINWYFLATMPDDVEEVKTIQEQKALSKEVAQVIEHNEVFTDQFNAFLLMLNQKKWRDAVDFYRNEYASFLKLNGVTEQNHPLTSQLLITLQYLLAENETEHLSTLANYLVVWFPQKVEFIQFQMMGLIQKGKINQAIDVYFLKSSEISDIEQKQVFTDSFDQWLDKQLLVWHGNNSDDVSELVWQKLLKYDTQNVKWTVQLAQILVWQHRYKQAKSVIDPVQFEWDYQDQISQIFSEINMNYNSNESINLEKVGSHYLVDAVFSDNGITPDVVDVKLLIDTGASYTVIDQQVFDDYFLYVDKKRTSMVTANTANGQVEAQMYEVFEIKIGDYSVNNIQFIVLDLPDDGSSAQGLLGMNFLEYFKFNIDQSNSVLTLSY
ncbi:retropepsin-like aspartic protease family protein [Marinicellulosiphila megalodicopiae]|uniref:retropepsin-like aspartic protease family protein n=1 Tax=Marinicellulosiphila megalodicopiae TaxID=2724896 RepID=UPI003BAF8910